MSEHAIRAPEDMILALRACEAHFNDHACEGSLLDRDNQILATGEFLFEESQWGYLTLWIRGQGERDLEPVPTACTLQIRRRNGDLLKRSLIEAMVGPAGPCSPHYLLKLRQSE